MTVYDYQVRLSTRGPYHVEWERKSFRKYIDAEGEEDMGNVDFLRYHGDHWYAGGDWGEVRISTTSRPRFTLGEAST